MLNSHRFGSEVLLDQFGLRPPDIVDFRLGHADGHLPVVDRHAVIVAHPQRLSVTDATARQETDRGAGVIKPERELRVGQAGEISALLVHRCRASSRTVSGVPAAVAR